jgi:nitrite reductase/ring-hydroxylating ferredoxin subunit
MVLMAIIRIASIGELPQGTLFQRETSGGPVALCNHKGTIHAFDGRCPHHGGPLGQGNLVDGCIVCPWHGWEFSVERGELDYNPGIKLRRYSVSVDGNSVFVEVPDEKPPAAS